MNAVIQTPTNKLENSLEFYRKLNYQVVSENNPTIVSDGKFFIEINPERTARAGLKIYKSSWQAEVEKLKQHTTIYTIEHGYLLNDLNNCYIYLMDESASPSFEAPDVKDSYTGNCMGLSLESANMDASIKIWEILGFSIVMGDSSKGFVVLTNASGFGVSLMKPLTCPHLFFNPSLTFFNGEKNLEYIAKIRSTGIPITEEVTHFNEEGIVDNIIIRDPGGLGFFIFND
jgi:hypothetical protein